MAAQPLHELSLELLKKTEGCDEAELARRRIIVVRKGETLYNTRIDLDRVVGRNDFDPAVMRRILDKDVSDIVKADVVDTVEYTIREIPGVLGETVVTVDSMYLVKVLAMYDGAFPKNASKPPYRFRKGETHWVSNRQAELALFEELKRSSIASVLWDTVVKDIERTGTEHRYDDAKNPNKFYAEFEEAKSKPIELLTLEIVHRFDRYFCSDQISQRVRNMARRAYTLLAKYRLVERKGAHQFAAKTYVALDQQNVKVKPYKTE